MAVSKALLIFCEGAHDVAFVRNVFKHTMSAKAINLKFSEYPSPFNQLFRTTVENNAAEDLTLDMAKKFFLPDRVMVKDEWLILLFNAGGKGKVPYVKSFLKDFLPLLSAASTFRADAEDAIEEARYLFLYDADHQTAPDICAWMQRQYAKIDDTSWEIGSLEIPVGSNGAFIDNKGMYVWSSDTGKGTLEDILKPLYCEKDAKSIQRAEAFVDQFTWSPKGSGAKEVTAHHSNTIKAILCSAGQQEKPGRPLAAIIDDDVLGGSNVYQKSNAVAEFSDFVQELMA